MSEDERRRYERVPVRIQVRFGTSDLEHECRARDISVGGVFLVTETTFPPGTRLHLHVRADNDFYVEAIVIRKEDEGMGCRFLGPDEFVTHMIPREARKLDTRVIHLRDEDAVHRLLHGQLSTGLLIVRVENPAPPVDTFVEFKIIKGFGEPDELRGRGRIVKILTGKHTMAMVEVRDAVELEAALSAYVS